MALFFVHMSSRSGEEIEKTGARLLCEALVNEGVDTIFGYPGGAVLHIYDELVNFRDSMTHVLARHEQGAVHMAEGYAKATGEVGVALVTSGPGATNTVTGIANAFMDSTPLVVITGQVPTHLLGTDGFQEIDIVGITRACTKYNYLVRSTDEIPEIVREAFYLAASGRPGPVLIDIPKDLTAKKAARIMPDKLEIPGYAPHSFADSEKVEKAVEKMLAAKRPVFYVGGGVVHSGGSRELAQLVDRLAIPVTITLMGLSCFPSAHPRSLGMLGMHGSYAANMSISEADVIIAIGVRFDDRVTGDLKKFAPHAEIVHVDIDESSIDKNVLTHISMIGNAKDVMQQILDSLDRRPAPAEKRLEAWWETIRAWQTQAPISYENHPDIIRPQLLCEEISRMTDGDAIITTDVGQHQMWLAQYYKFRHPRSFLTSGGLGTMGYGFPAAIGAQLAKRGKLVVAFVGDGGFQMTMQELATAVQYRANVKVIVMNNGFLGMVRQWQEVFYDNNYSEVDMQFQPDFVKLAESFGAVGLRADHPAKLTEVLKKGFAIDGPVVMDIVVSQEENVYPMVPPGAGLKEMILR
ncbi:MAG TPA: biosynthetic-type acetolactate synthase large subunit [Pyrinomonadaceae bacterium]|nr:biosynthetic-type acetolactate synthase large subunit [Pyrinomonadaceae bacterium]